MKKQKIKTKKNLFKKIFVKICRILGYEIIDQGNFYLPSQEKLLTDNLSIQGKKSINIPLGVTTISRKVEALTVIFRSCTNVTMLTQNKKRLFDQKKSEYTFRSLNSIIVSLKESVLNFPKIQFDIIIIETVGVGQIELDIIQAADSIVVVLVPESGDEVQMLKAGLMEIGNIFSINKADRPGANKLMITLQNFLATLSKDEDNWSPQVVHTVATEGKGTDELVSSIDSHRSFNEKQGIHKQKMEERYRQRITELITDDYVERFWDDTNCLKLQRELKKNHHDRTSPYDLAKQMLSK